ncbi:hypothetical protein LQV63_20240 [Paenibacillus profundus]|uniref:Uncharacterized protein n=1 Tax=Paenibacillus profundus TaxID=1173085 RepID=A0ABS8YMT7_9BACL|nr:hypothetical protein [Paenibacillus profundus]MCE5171621.1 hypothetical protein [Paenibacillus profundus]
MQNIDSLALLIVQVFLKIIGNMLQADILGIIIVVGIKFFPWGSYQ